MNLVRGIQFVLIIGVILTFTPVSAATGSSSTISSYLDQPSSDDDSGISWSGLSSLMGNDQISGLVSFLILFLLRLFGINLS